MTLTFAAKNLSHLQAIENAVHLHREKANADANLYEAQKTAEADALYLSDEYLELLALEAVTNKAIIVYGDDIPDMLVGGEGGAAAAAAVVASRPAAAAASGEL